MPLSTRSLLLLKRLYPVLAFFGGFIWDALTLGQKVKTMDFWRLGACLFGAGLIILWLARRDFLATAEPEAEGSWRGRWQGFVWQMPYLLLPFCYGSIFSALFILYFKSAGHLGTWAMALFLGVLLVANEFWGQRQRYGRRFTLTWALFALNAILLMNFVLPHAVGSLSPAWFYISTAIGAGLAHGLRRLAPGQPGRIGPAWGVALALLLAWNMDMIAPVPLVAKDLAVGHDFRQQSGSYQLKVEGASPWQFWKREAKTIHVAPGEKLYGISAVFAPLGVSAPLEHRWEMKDADGKWQLVNRIPFTANGGRERGFRGHSYVLNPAAGEWRFSVATQDGRTIALHNLLVEPGQPVPERLSQRDF